MHTALRTAAILCLALLAPAHAAGPRVVYRPNYPGRKLQFQLPPAADARFRRIVAARAPVSELAPNAPRLGPTGFFDYGKERYLYFAEAGVLWKNLEGNRYQTWSDERLKEMGKQQPRYGAWNEATFRRWIRGLERPPSADRRSP